MNIVDLFIALIVIFALIRGTRLGLFYVFFSISATLIGLLIGIWLGQIVAQFAYTELSRTLIIVGFAAASAVSLSEAGVRIAKHLTQKSAELKLDLANSTGGAILETIFLLIILWLASPALVNIQSAQLGRQVRESTFVGMLHSELGQPPDIFAQISNSITPNGFPSVFALDEPALQAPAAPIALDPEVIERAHRSVVKVEGLGCGGVVNGSGWVAANGLVITNAHVVSGITSPTIVDAGRTYRATTVLFDPNLDIAALSIPDLKLPALPYHESLLADGSPGAILGFPGGGREVASPSVIIDNVIATGRNIYNLGTVQRQIYEITADVQQGDSGGPLIDKDGSVAGIVFAKAVSQANVGYAITMPQALPSIRSADANRTPVSTGRCNSEQ